MPIDDFTLRFRGAIAWAKFELPKAPAKTPQYRAGVEFTDADAQAIDNFCSKHRDLAFRQVISRRRRTTARRRNRRG